MTIARAAPVFAAVDSGTADGPRVDADGALRWSIRRTRLAPVDAA